jgi:hypothetical protein
LNIAARSFSLLLHAWCVFCRKSKLAWFPRAPHPDDAALPPDGTYTHTARSFATSSYPALHISFSSL